MNPVGNGKQQRGSQQENKLIRLRLQNDYSGKAVEDTLEREETQAGGINWSTAVVLTRSDEVLP